MKQEALCCTLNFINKLNAVGLCLRFVQIKPNYILRIYEVLAARYLYTYKKIKNKKLHCTCYKKNYWRCS